MKSLYLCTLIISSALLSACSLAPTAEPLVTYQLAPLETAVHQQAPLPLSLRINKPNASGYLASNRMLVVNEHNQLSLYKGVQWNEATPLLVRNHLLDSFRQANVLNFVSNDDKRLMANIELDSDLRAFHIEYQQQTAITVVTLVVRLLDANTKKILATQTFNQRLSAPSTELNQVVMIFNQAQNQLAQSVMDWSYRILSQQK